MQRPIDILIERLYTAGQNKEIIDMKYIYAAVTLDIINEYCFAREPVEVLKPDVGKKGFDDVDSFLAVSLLNNHIPWLMRVTYSFPDLARQVQAIRDGNDRAHEKASHRIIFHELLSRKLPRKRTQAPSTRDEAFSLAVAGSGTTAYVLRGTAYHISTNPHIQERLYTELKLPSLAAIIQKGLRLCDPATHRVERQFPDKTFTYKNHVLPPNTLIAMTSLLTHRNEKIYPDPETFRPERWLEDEGGKRLERYLVSFSRGARSCLGVNLARTELYLILAAVFRRFTFGVEGVDRDRDIEAGFDYMLGAQARDSPGIRVSVECAE